VNYEVAEAEKNNKQKARCLLRGGASGSCFTAISSCFRLKSDGCFQTQALGNKQEISNFFL